MAEIEPHEIERVYMLEDLVTRALNNDRRAIRELYVIQPELFERGTRTYTILEPYLYNSERVK